MTSRAIVLAAVLAATVGGRAAGAATIDEPFPAGPSAGSSGLAPAREEFTQAARQRLAQKVETRRRGGTGPVSGPWYERLGPDGWREKLNSDRVKNPAIIPRPADGQRVK